MEILKYLSGVFNFMIFLRSFCIWFTFPLPSFPSFLFLSFSWFSYFEFKLYFFHSSSQKLILLWVWPILIGIFSSSFQWLSNEKIHIDFFFFFSNQTNISKSPIPLTVINKINGWSNKKQKKKGGVNTIYKNYGTFGQF